MITLTTKKGQQLTVNPCDVLIVEIKKQYPHWIIWLLAALLFLPFVLALFFLTEKVVEIRYQGASYIITEKCYYRLLDAKQKCD